MIKESLEAGRALVVVSTGGRSNYGYRCAHPIVAALTTSQHV